MSGGFWPIHWCWLTVGLFYRIGLRWERGSIRSIFIWWCGLVIFVASALSLLAIWFRCIIWVSSGLLLVFYHFILFGVVFSGWDSRRLTYFDETFLTLCCLLYRGWFIEVFCDFGFSFSRFTGVYIWGCWRRGSFRRDFSEFIGNIWCCLLSRTRVMGIGSVIILCC